MSHHISTRFVGAFAKIHITQGKYLSQKLQNALGERILLLLFCPPAIRAKSFIPTYQVSKSSFFVYNCRLM